MMKTYMRNFSILVLGVSILGVTGVSQAATVAKYGNDGTKGFKISDSKLNDTMIVYFEDVIKGDLFDSTTITDDKEKKNYRLKIDTSSMVNINWQSSGSPFAPTNLFDELTVKLFDNDDNLIGTAGTGDPQWNGGALNLDAGKYYFTMQGEFGRDVDFGATLTTYVSATPVPVPAAIWLLGSALLGLVGIKRTRV